MIGTLFMQEARTQTRRIAAVIAAGCLVAAGFLGLWWLFARQSVLAGLMQAGAVCALMAVLIAVPILLATEYWASMYGARGYLTMSLPVRGREIFAAKVLWAVLVMVVAVAVFVLGMTAWLSALAHQNGTSLAAFLDPVRSFAAAAGPGRLVLLTLVCLGALVIAVLEVAGILTIGAEGRWNHLGLAAPALGLVALYVVSEVVSTAATLLLPLSVRISGPGTGDLVAQSMLPDFLRALREGAGAMNQHGDVALLGVGAVLVAPVLAALIAWWAVRSIERHTSLR